MGQIAFTTSKDEATRRVNFRYRIVHASRAADSNPTYHERMPEGYHRPWSRKCLYVRRIHAANAARLLDAESGLVLPPTICKVRG